MEDFDYDPSEASTVWPEGDYQAVIKSYEVGTSKTSGAPMMTLKLTVYNGEQTREIDDYIVRKTDTSKGTMWKLKSLASALGKAEEFKAKTFQVRDHIGDVVSVYLTVQEASGKYEERNQIGGYDEYTKPSPSATATTANASMNNNARRMPANVTIGKDDIPF